MTHKLKALYTVRSGLLFIVILIIQLLVCLSVMTESGASAEWIPEPQGLFITIIRRRGFRAFRYRCRFIQQSSLCICGVFRCVSRITSMLKEAKSWKPSSHPHRVFYLHISLAVRSLMFIHTVCRIWLTCGGIWRDLCTGDDRLYKEKWPNRGDCGSGSSILHHWTPRCSWWSSRTCSCCHQWWMRSWVKAL